MNRLPHLLLSLILSAQNSLPLAGVGGAAAGGGSNATFVNSAQCVANATASCTASSLSIPSGDLIVAGESDDAGGATTFSDSNCDSFSCATRITEATNSNSAQLCVTKAGATVTSVTCTQTFSTGHTNCMVLWYTPGSLSGIKDQEASSDQQNIQNWSTGSTPTLTGSNDLVAVIWADLNLGRTTTHTDSTTERLPCTGTGTNTSCAISDKNVSGTAPVAGSGANSAGAAFQAVEVLAVK